MRGIDLYDPAGVDRTVHSERNSKEEILDTTGRDKGG